MNKNEISLDTKDLILHCIFDSNRIYDQPDDGLEKSSKHVVVPKIRHVKNLLSNNIFTVVFDSLYLSL